ncbi:MAG: hypothetical protein HQ581_09515 [Planctomycetes bacterium]|nr:hypothetical protein [Planctomycetota bacterium]
MRKLVVFCALSVFCLGSVVGCVPPFGGAAPNSTEAAKAKQEAAETAPCCDKAKEKPACCDKGEAGEEAVPKTPES